MAEIRVLKIDGSGFTAEHIPTADELTMRNLTAGTTVQVSGGIKMQAASIVFANDTDTIESPSDSIQIQNLLDKTATETINGTFTFSTTPQLTGSIANPNDMVDKDYVDTVAQNIDWQDSVKAIIASGPGAGSALGDRYIVASGATGGFAGEDEKIAEFFTSWIFQTPNEGWAAWVEDEDLVYIYNDSHPTGEWIKFASVFNHNNLNGLQGGTANEYYHMTATEDTWLASALIAVPGGSDLLDKTGNETITGNWTFNGENDFTNGTMTLPSGSSASPSDGEVYWDGTGDTLYIYDGAQFVDISADADVDDVSINFIGGTGGIQQYEAVYISSNDTVLPADADALSTAKVIGVAPLAISQGNTGAIITFGLAESAISGIGASAGDPIFLSTTSGALATSPPIGFGDVVVRVGWAKNTTDLLVNIGPLRRRASS